MSSIKNIPRFIKKFGIKSMIKKIIDTLEYAIKNAYFKRRCKKRWRKHEFSKAANIRPSRNANGKSNLKFNLYHSCIDRNAGGIQNTAYCFMKELENQYVIQGLCGKMRSDSIGGNFSIKNNITEIENFTIWKAIPWVMKNSDSETWNIVMNCWMGLPALLAKIVSHAHYFVLAHGNDVYDISTAGNGLKAKVYHTINKIILKKADFVACNSNYTLNLLRNLNLDHAYIIPPPCDLCENTEGISFEPNMIFSVGRLVERKGFQFVIDAVDSLKKDFPEIKYYIAGSGEYEDELKKRIEKLHLEEFVFLLGNISYETKINYMKRCCVFAMPSIEIPSSSNVEGFGIVYLEANQFGKYVIGSASGGISDAICQNETGSILNVVNGNTVADEIKRIINNAEFYYSEELINKRKEWAYRHCSKNIIGQYIEIVENYT